ncbi:Hypothetical_protein [Hexamita inflata]|uniref:Hypothetical_protein n=1 Tax=Hexamita inflata TaxID=28002 RepID=A0ABP1GF46_9EUKA
MSDKQAFNQAACDILGIQYQSDQQVLDAISNLSTQEAKIFWGDMCFSTNQPLSTLTSYWLKQQPTSSNLLKQQFREALAGSLFLEYGQYFEDKSDADLCSFILAQNNDTHKAQLWQRVAQVLGQDIKYVRDYFNKTWSRAGYTKEMNQCDKETIFKIVQEHKSANCKEIVDLAMNALRSRNLFRTQVQRTVKKYLEHVQSDK